MIDTVRPARGAALPGHGRVYVGYAVMALLLLMALAPQLFVRQNPDATAVASMLEPPSWHHLFGTDNIGRDVYARVIYGTRVTLALSVGSVLIATIVGSSMGVLAAFYGSLLDTLAGRVADVIFSFPTMFLGVLITGIMGPGARDALIALSLVFVPVFFRIARAQVLVEREKPYVEAASAIGRGPGAILFRHVLPNVISPILLQATVSIPVSLQLGAALDYLGLGVQPPVPSWGGVLNDGRDYLLSAPWISVFPGLFILLATIAFLWSAEGLRRRLDPRAQKEWS